MRIYTLECELTSPTPIEDTFRAFQNPYNLARITPPSLGFKIVTEGLVMRKGLEIDYEFRWLGLPMSWKTLITEYEPPFYFVDEAVKSPYALWRHRHTFRPTGAGTVVSDRVEYALPLGPFGQLAHRLVVSRQLKRIFNYRQQAIAALVGTDPVALVEPVLR